MKDKTDSLNHEYISPIEVEDRQDALMNREDFKTGLGQTIHTEEDHSMDRIIEVGHDMILIRSFICNTKRASVKQSIILQVSSNLADEPSSANVPPPV